LDALLQVGRLFEQPYQILLWLVINDCLVVNMVKFIEKVFFGDGVWELGLR
jgi:hypothetical protein